MFSCPRCDGRLVRTKTEHGFAFDCHKCHGRAIGLAVIRQVVPDRQTKALWRLASSGPKVRGVRCPVCRQAMKEVELPVGDNQDVVLDICKRCQFLWFDTDEFDELPHKLPVAEHQRELPEEAREAVALAQIKHLAEQERGNDFGGDEPEETWKWIPALFGLPVEHEVEPISTLPWLTWGLSLVLVTISVLILAFGDLNDVIQRYGLIPSQPFRDGGITFLTSFLLHAGILHLIGNTYFLLVFGDNVGDYLGRIRYILLLVCATLIGDVLHIIGDPRSEMPCVGASGGISGIIVFYALQFPHARLGLAIRYWYVIRWVHFPAYFAVICWIGFQVFTAYLQMTEASNVSGLAHLGGAATGLVAWLLWKKR